MSEIGWTFLSNHGRVFCYLAKHPNCTIEGLAIDVGLSLAGIHIIMNDLEEAGYITRKRIGRCNQYIVHPELPMRHHLEWDHTVAEFLLAADSKWATEKDKSGGRQTTRVEAGRPYKAQLGSLRRSEA